MSIIISTKIHCLSYSTKAMLAYDRQHGQQKISEKNKELPLLKTLKNYLDRQDNIYTVLQEGR